VLKEKSGKGQQGHKKHGTDTVKKNKYLTVAGISRPREIAICCISEIWNINSNRL